MSNTANHTTRIVRPAVVRGACAVPASKSHTIRALLIAACADGPSHIAEALDSEDTRSCISALRQFGVGIRELPGAGLQLEVQPPAEGLAGSPHGRREPVSVDVGNSGTTLYLLTALAALRSAPVSFDGDESIRRRSAGPLLSALSALGARVDAPTGAAPYSLRGPLLSGREIEIESPTSQYLSALLLATPLINAASARGAARDRPATTIHVRRLNEHPYVDMTCSWLDAQEVPYSRSGYDRFTVPGGARYRPFSRTLTGDYSSATFWMCAAALTGGEVRIAGLDPRDVQGDRGVIDVLAALGVRTRWEAGNLVVAGRPTRGGAFDLNAMPDALPALAVLGCACPEPVTFAGVPQARSKETDRVAVMARELGALGADVRELPDGLTVRPSTLTGGRVHSHGDHRVAMACAIAALASDGPVEIVDSDVAGVTYPNFFSDLAAVAPGSVE